MQYASWIQRVGAYLVSVLVLAAIQGLGVGATVVLGERNWVTGVLLAGAFVFWIADRWVFSGRTGQTLGRRVLGIRMVDAGNGEPIGVWLAFVRDLWHVADAAPCYLGFLAPSGTPSAGPSPTASSRRSSSRPDPRRSAVTGAGQDRP